ncbi:MAG: alpha-galactosidase [Nocardioides sp.]|uniref:alpha-galactosidase n=1 Tax=Nocardioides sp. TaxID=35761 RepID=UPI003F10030D
MSRVTAAEGPSIEVSDDGVFRLSTATTSYWFLRTEHGHLEHVHLGRRLAPQDPTALRWRRTARVASAVTYVPDGLRYSLDTVPLEWSGVGQGDYRRPSLEVLTAASGYDLDLTYRSHRVVPGALPAATLPTARGSTEQASSLEVVLADDRAGIEVRLLWTVFADADVITRRAVVRNTGTATATVEAVASAQLDLPDRGWQVMTLDGTWIRETHAHVRDVTPGTFSVGSTTGSSSNRHNPGVLLLEAGADEDRGRVVGVNLVHSGNHLTTVERGVDGLVRLTTGIHPQSFAWPLAPGEELETPEAVIALSDAGLNGLSAAMHRFVEHHVVPERYAGRERPVVLNTWEAMKFDLSERRVLKQARQAAELGIEMLVVDDGWFTRRDDDTAGLGDYTVDRRKFPRGLGPFVDKVRGLGLEAGIWVEPEMVSEDSDLYRAHPDWAMRVPGKPPRLGRHQHVLDLCNPAVCDYLVDSVGALLDSAAFTYVKWDMNRHLSDLFSPHVAHPGMVAHTYAVNLHRVLERIFAPRPHVWLETCSSGGNRFDLAMLTHSAMVWSSDDTDPVERLEIQQGLSYLYPPSVISNHVSDAPHEQTLRMTPLSTRFNVAAFGVLGYEYDLDLLTAAERKEVRDQVAFYKEHRATLQHGRFRRHRPPGQRDRFVWQVGDASTTVVGNFQRHVGAAPEPDLLPVAGLEADTAYTVVSKPQRLMIDRFGALINHVSPVRLDPRGLVIGTAAKHVTMDDAAESYEGTGALLGEGVRLAHQFIGTEYNDGLRMLGDHGSTLYVVRKKE